MIQPTIGRKVWFRLNGGSPVTSSARQIEVWDTEQALDATVVFVHNDNLVNLRVTDHTGESHSIRSVTLVQEGAPVPLGMYCECMPYQKGQAAKTEAAAIVSSQDVQHQSV